METDATEDSGLRERKKRRTREAIADAALRLFEERGFAATTIADIAAAADISPRTFFGYFPSKEAVLFADHDEAFAAFEREMAEPRVPGRTVLDVLREWIHSWFGAHPPEPARDELLQRLKATDPSVAAQERQLLARFEDRIAHGLAVDLGYPAGDVRARMVAAAAVASLRALAPHDEDGCTPMDDPAEKLAALDDALQFLSSGLAALLPRAAACRRSAPKRTYDSRH